MTRIIAALVALPILAGPGVAQEVGLDAGTATIQSTQGGGGGFAGAYGGLTLGYGRLDTDPGDDDPEGLEFFDDDGGSINYGLHGGYNIQRNNLVFGGELSLFGGNVELDDDNSDSETELNYGARLLGRVGYDFGRGMVYGALGPTYMNIDIDSREQSDWGAAYGIGVAFPVREQFLIGAEFIRHDFEDFDDVDDGDLTYDTFNLKMSFRF